MHPGLPQAEGRKNPHLAVRRMDVTLSAINESGERGSPHGMSRLAQSTKAANRVLSIFAKARKRRGVSAGGANIRPISASPLRNLPVLQVLERGPGVRIFRNAITLGITPQPGRLSAGRQVTDPERDTIDKHPSGSTI